MRKADNLPPSCAVVTKSGTLNFLEPSGPVQACNGTALPLCAHSNGICHTCLLTACEQAIYKPDGQRNCPKHVEFYSKNKLDKLVHVVGFIIRIII